MILLLPDLYSLFSHNPAILRISYKTIRISVSKQASFNFG